MSRIIFTLGFIAIAIIVSVYAAPTLVYEITSDPGIDLVLNVDLNDQYVKMIDIQSARAYIEGETVYVEVEFANPPPKPNELNDLPVTWFVDIGVELSIGDEGVHEVAIYIGKTADLGVLPGLCENSFLMVGGTMFVNYSVDGNTLKTQCTIDGYELKPPVAGYEGFKVESIFQYNSTTGAGDTAETQSAKLVLDEGGAPNTGGDGGDSVEPGRDSDTDGEDTGPSDESGEESEVTEEPSDNQVNNLLSSPLIPFAALVVIGGIVAYIIKMFLGRS